MQTKIRTDDFSREAQWIRPVADFSGKVPIFFRSFRAARKVVRAELKITATGVYEAELNGRRVGDFVLAPGWTAYAKRLQYQTYDVTDLLERDNALTVTVAPGWYRSRGIGDPNAPIGLLVDLALTFSDGKRASICSDARWRVSEGKVRFAEIYDGEVYDATFEPDFAGETEAFEGPFSTLIPQQGEPVREQETVAAARIFRTPAGEVVLDFGQELTGYVKIDLEASAGEVVDLSFGEVLDREGNFYNANYRSAKCLYRYVCRAGRQTYRPQLTFYGFRYVRVNAFPGGVDRAAPENFCAVVVHSEMQRTGWVSCTDPLLNRLFSNVLWSQKGNFLDVPTDCPQRDERLGWTGDAQVFVRTACLQFDAEKFFTKWLGDVAAEQTAFGAVNRFVPNRAGDEVYGRAAWGDAAVICPWELYLAYGNPEILERQYDSMCKWIGYIGSATTTPYLWTGGLHNGDWLALDSPEGSYKGATREDFIATAFYAHSTSLVVKAGKALGKEVSEYEKLYRKIVQAFRKTYSDFRTQTECVLAAHFGLAEDPRAAAELLVRKIHACGDRLQTGFVGTPYLLHVLSDFGYTELAYTLLLRREYPSWLYAVEKGATTIWEHWDGIKADGTFWSDQMNSYNHYCYGSVLDWVYGVAAGIRAREDAPGYARATIAPHPDKRLDGLCAVLRTRRGPIRSAWQKQGNLWRFEIETPVPSVIEIAGRRQEVQAGSYLFYEKISESDRRRK